MFLCAKAIHVHKRLSWCHSEKQTSKLETSVMCMADLAKVFEIMKPLTLCNGKMSVFAGYKKQMGVGVGWGDTLVNKVLAV